MLRPGHSPWWKRMLAIEPARVATAQVARRCPDCSESYEYHDRYCPRCHSATPEWRYG